MRNFRDLNVRANAHRLTLDVDAATRAFPNDERSGVSNRLPRAASSIAANLAGGSGHGTDAEVAQDAPVAMGSASEAGDLGLLHDQSCAKPDTHVAEAKRRLASLLAGRTSNGSGARLTADS